MEDLKSFQYRRMNEERRGWNFQYYTDKLDAELERKGYEMHVFENGDRDTMNILGAKEIVSEYRKNGYFARIVCMPNRLRIKYAAIYFKKK